MGLPIVLVVMTTLGSVLGAKLGVGSDTGDVATGCATEMASFVLAAVASYIGAE